MEHLSSMTGGEYQKPSFISHVFSSTEEGKAEFLNVIQYSSLAVIPVVILNKLIQRFIPEADLDKSTLELLAEIIIQLVVMFCGIIIIHRVITFLPTYSGYKYENLTLTNVILAFLILVLSIQTKMGIKVNILYDRLLDLWNGTDDGEKKTKVKKSVRINEGMSSQHAPSQSDYLDSSPSGAFPPLPASTSNGSPNGTYDTMMRGSPSSNRGGNGDGMYFDQGPMAANGVLGGSFGSFFN
jgi:hypothetical protein